VKSAARAVTSLREADPVRAAAPESALDPESSAKPRARDLVGEFVNQILEQGMSISQDTTAMIQAQITRIDALLDLQLREIIQHPDFRRLSTLAATNENNAAFFEVENRLKADGSKLSVSLTPTADGLRADNIIQQIEPLRRLVEARERLNELRIRLEGNEDLDVLLQAIAGNREGQEQIKAAMDESVVESAR
jgi:hypothetical protein